MFVTNVVCWRTSGELLCNVSACLPCLQGGITLGFVFAVMRQVAAGLRHLHTLGILHRDLRAANVLLASLEPLQVPGCCVWCAWHPSSL